MSYEIQLDEHGMPVMLADVPNAGVSRADPNAPSGNPNHDVRSGKFGEGGGGRAQQGPQAPPNADPVEWGRFLDAVREAAREFDSPDIGDIQDFLKGRAKNPAQVDAEQFLSAVNEQRISDLVDILDQQLRSGGVLPRNRKRVTLKAPRGFLKRALNSLDDSRVAELGHRLEAMGHPPEEVDAFLKGRVNEKRHEAIDTHKQAIAASNTWEGDLFEYVGGPPVAATGDYDSVELANAFGRAMGQMPAPVVHVTVPITTPAGTKKVVRDPETGFVTEIKDE